jgi:LemA protein
MVVFLGLLGFLAVVGAWLAGIYNRSVRLKVRYQDAWALIDVQLKRRYELSPNLVETIKAYATHERGTAEAVVQARQAGIDAGTIQEQAQAENKITFSRQNYNDNVHQYNTRIESFPDNILARMFGFQHRDFFELEDAEQREAPQVKF